MTVLALGGGLWLAALALQDRDVTDSIAFLDQIWMDLSVVFYGIELVALLGTPDVPLELLNVMTVLMLVSGAMEFRRSERLFSHVI
jgi:ABC-type polysaccharide/polyol phosphate export permease